MGGYRPRSVIASGAKQSSSALGLPRRFAPRNDGVRYDRYRLSFGHSLRLWCAINIEIEAQAPLTKTSESFRTQGKALVTIFKK